MNRLEILERARLLAVSLASGRELSRADDFGFMCLCFLSRQVEHAESIRSLHPSRDTVLVARSMIEGAMMLLWAASDPSRALRWRRFMSIENWRLVRRRETAGRRVPDSSRQRMKEALNQVGSEFLNTIARKHVAKGAPLPIDPYVRKWTDGTSYNLSDLCTKLRVRDLHAGVYVHMSDWTHWGSASIGRILRDSGEEIHYRPPGDYESSLATLAATMSILHTTATADAHFAADFKGAIRAIIDESQ